MVWLCLYVADPATSLASNSVLGSLNSSENSLIIQSRKKKTYFSLYYYLINIVNIKNLTSATLS